MADEKIYTIPLRKAFEISRKKRAPYAMRLIQDFLTTHTKAEEIKIGARLNQEVWKRGIRKPPRSVRVKAVKDGNVVKAELMGHDYVEFKTKPKKERAGMQEKLLGRLGPKALQKQKEEEMVEGKETGDEEKQKSVEAIEKAAKEAAQKEIAAQKDLKKPEENGGKKEEKTGKEKKDEPEKGESKKE